MSPLYLKEVHKIKINLNYLFLTRILNINLIKNLNTNLFKLGIFLLDSKYIKRESFSYFNIIGILFYKHTSYILDEFKEYS